jgi:hypothetical protein
MRTGDFVLASAVYRPRCCISVDRRLARAESAPPCPECRRPTEWRFVRTDARVRWRPLRELAAAPVSVQVRL